MKVKQEHYQEILDGISALGTDKINQHKQYLLSPENPRKPKDLEMRLRWDCLNYTLGSKWICDNLYSYCNDDHIDTALKRVMKEIIVDKQPE